jgi:prephenate dehydrogenase
VAHFSFDKILILGVGLIGGSLALALKRQHPGGTIVGVARSAASLERALELGVIDAALGLTDSGLAEAVGTADIVVCAAPVAQTGPLLAHIAPWLRGRTVVSDVGSTKSDAVAAAYPALGPEAWRFVPAHPIAGREASGVEAALADLYQDRQTVLCPLPENTPAAVARVRAMWGACGARVQTMSAARHDAVFASVSHLPHVLAFALIEQILRAPDAELKLALAGSGFRDFTRIAASSPQVWRDICVANRAALLSDLDAFGAVLDEIRQALETGDGAALQAVFERTSAARAAWGAPAVALVQKGGAAEACVNPAGNPVAESGGHPGGEG